MNRGQRTEGKGQMTLNRWQMIEGRLFARILVLMGLVLAIYGGMMKFFVIYGCFGPIHRPGKLHIIIGLFFVLSALLLHSSRKYSRILLFAAIFVLGLDFALHIKYLLLYPDEINILDVIINIVYGTICLGAIRILKN